jgi:hypothetical protein
MGNGPTVLFAGLLERLVINTVRLLAMVDTQYIAVDVFSLSSLLLSFPEVFKTLHSSSLRSTLCPLLSLSLQTEGRSLSLPSAFMLPLANFQSVSGMISHLASAISCPLLSIFPHRCKQASSLSHTLFCGCGWSTALQVNASKQRRVFKTDSDTLEFLHPDLLNLNSASAAGLGVTALIPFCGLYEVAQH